MTLQNHLETAIEAPALPLSVEDYLGSRELLHEIIDTDPSTITTMRSLVTKVLGVSAAINNIVIVNGAPQETPNQTTDQSGRSLEPLPNENILRCSIVDDSGKSNKWLEAFPTKSGTEIIELRNESGRARLDTLYVPSDETIHAVDRLDHLSLRQHPFDSRDLKKYEQGAPNKYFQDLQRLAGYLLRATGELQQ